MVQPPTGVGVGGHGVGVKVGVLVGVRVGVWVGVFVGHGAMRVKVICSAIYRPPVLHLTCISLDPYGTFVGIDVTQLSVDSIKPLLSFVQSHFKVYVLSPGLAIMVGPPFDIEYTVGCIAAN